MAKVIVTEPQTERLITLDTNGSLEDVIKRVPRCPHCQTRVYRTKNGNYQCMNMPINQIVGLPPIAAEDIFELQIATRAKVRGKVVNSVFNSEGKTYGRIRVGEHQPGEILARITGLTNWEVARLRPFKKSDLDEEGIW